MIDMSCSIIRQIFIEASCGVCMDERPLEGTDTMLARCTGRGASYRISGSDISLFMQSPFSLYCKHFVDRSEMDPPDASQHLFADHGRNHETRIMRELYPEQAPPEPEQPHETRGKKAWLAPARRSGARRRRISPEEHAARLDKSRIHEFKKTLNTMFQGEPALMEPQLCFFPRGMHGSPDVLERHDGESFLGDYHYVVKEIKSSKKIKRKHVMQAAFYNVMLGEIQGRLPDSFYLLNADGKNIQYEHAEFIESIDGIISGITEIKNGQVPNVLYGRGVFPWSNYADKVAIEKDDLSLIPSILSQHRDLLLAAHICTVSDLQDSKESALIDMGIRPQDASTYVARATAVKSGRPTPLGTVRVSRPGAEVFLRVEEAMHGEVYMIGALVRTDGTRNHHYFVSDADGEAGMLAGFLNMLDIIGEYTVYYWGSGDAAISRLVAKYREDDTAIPMTDLQQMAARLVAFPTYRNQLRMIAEWMGYVWQDPDADWGRGVMAYSAYMRDKDRQDCLGYIIQYSKDNCAAVEAVHDWLLEHHYILQ